MNHVEFYESIINDYTNGTVELRVYIKNFQQMPLRAAHETIDKIKEMLNMKEDDLRKLKEQEQ